MNQRVHSGLAIAIKPKDFLETKEGLIFAVVGHQIENGRVLSFLRYVKSKQGWQKLNTDQANTCLRQSYPSYLYHSSLFDADLHGVLVDRITKHHLPTEKLNALMDSPVSNHLQEKFIELIDLLTRNGINLEHLGVTGSFLIGAENKKSDIDLVIYDHGIFHRSRKIIKNLIRRGELVALDDYFWKESFNRRACSLTLEEYIWHEKRKYNKAVFKGIKFDLSLVVTPSESNRRVYFKKGKIVLSAKVIDDQHAFDSPCSYSLDHQDYKNVICYTPTYAGQAMVGETVEISGFIEESEDGKDCRIIVGTSREASGEYIKVSVVVK